MFLWQQRHLNAPPVFTLQHDLEAHTAGILKDTRRLLEDSVKVTDVHRSLSCEIYIVQKITYKSHASLKNEKTLQGMKQLERSLKRLIEISPTTILKPLLDNWPSLISLHHGALVYLPSRQMLEHVLVRTVGCGALLHQTINRAVLTYTAAMDQIAIGMQTKNMLVFAAAASRVWFLCRSMKVQLNESYRQLLPLLDILKPTKAFWLKDGFEFPDDLRVWLGKELGMPSSAKEAKRLSVIPTYTGSKTNKNDEENLADRSMHNKSSDKKEYESQVKTTDMLMEDVGEVVSRSSSNVVKVDHLMEDVGQAVTRTKLSLQPNLSPKAKVTLPNDNADSPSKVPKAGPADLEEIFCLSSWLGKIQRCKTKQEMREVMKSFQTTFKIKSKRIKVCCRELKSSSTKPGCKTSDKKRCKTCLKKAAKLHAKKMMTDDRRRRQMDKTIQTSEKPANRNDSANEVVEVSTKTETTNSDQFDAGFVRLLRMKMLHPNGVRETLSDVNNGLISVGNVSWTIPVKYVSKLTKLLRTYLKGLKSVNKQDRTDIITGIVKQITRILVGNQTRPDGDVGNVNEFTAHDMSSKKLSLKQTGKSKKVAKKNPAKRALAADDKESKQFTVKRTMMKKEIGDQILKQKKGKKAKASKMHQQKVDAGKPSCQRKGSHKKDSNNNTNSKKSKTK